MTIITKEELALRISRDILTKLSDQDPATLLQVTTALHNGNVAAMPGTVTNVMDSAVRVALETHLASIF